MSFIAGYILGGCGAVKEIDPRIKKLDEAPTLWKFNIAEGWDIRVKIASDVDNMQYLRFANNHSGILDKITLWSAYFCVYLNDKFRYASCQNSFWTKRQENYQNGDIPNRLDSIYEYYGFNITSGNMTVKKGNANFLSLDAAGSYTMRQTPYIWTHEGDMIQGEIYYSEGKFSISKNDFGGNMYYGSYIVNGSADDFIQAVCGLYAVCRSLAD